MSYTSIEQARSHLVWNQPVSAKIIDQPILMTGTAALPFYNGSVNPESVVVKSFRDNAPQRTQLAISAEPAGLPDQHLVPGSVVVASDSSLGTVHLENEDYVIDYPAGQICIKEGGSLKAGDIVTVWYIAYALYVPDDDYRLNADAGTISRIASGRIADGETACLDYSPAFSMTGDEALAAAVREANSLVEREVDPQREFGADPVLACAATYRALEIVCRSAAVRDLAAGRGQDRTSAGWIKLAGEYGALADRLIKEFRPPITAPASPSRT